MDGFYCRLERLQISMGDHNSFAEIVEWIAKMLLINEFLIFFGE
jgi:hypothetical protein